MSDFGANLISLKNVSHRCEIAIFRCKLAPSLELRTSARQCEIALHYKLSELSLVRILICNWSVEMGDIAPVRVYILYFGSACTAATHLIDRFKNERYFNVAKDKHACVLK